MTRQRIPKLAALLPTLPTALRGGVDGMVRVRARQTPDAPALRTAERTWTWRELDAAADHRARFWAGRGVSPGQVVALVAGNHPEVPLNQLGLSRLGAASALVNPALRGAPLLHALRAAGAVALATDGERAGAVAALPEPLGTLAPRGGFCFDPPLDGPLIHLRAGLAATPQGPFTGPPKNIDSVFTYLYTSGTTGLPKAAPIRHLRFLMTGAAFHAMATWLSPEDVVFTALPLAHASAQLVGWSATIAAGACFAFAPRFSAHHFWRDAAAVDASVALYVGEVCRYLLAAADEAEPTPAGARRIHTFVGNGLRPDVWPAFVERFGRPRVVEFYGATEGNVLLVNVDGKVGACGRPLLSGPLDGAALVRYDVATDAHPRGADGFLQRCAPGEVGELIGHIGWLPHQRFDGYLDAKATGGKILRDVFAPGDAWFRSGDLLRVDADGDFSFVDRVGDTYRWKGENVSTQEVAEALNGAGGVEALTVYGVEVPGADGRAGMAAVLADRFDPAAFCARAEQALPAFARPVFVRVVGDLERTGTQKFKKSRLVAEGFDPGRCGTDPLFVRGDGTYVPLGASEFAGIVAGARRL